MVRFHGIDNRSVLFIFPTQFSTQLNMGTFHLVVYCLTDIMQQSRSLGKSHIQSQLRCQKT